MSLFSDPNQEVIYRILELLPTINQALHHMQTQLEELRLEGHDKGTGTCLLKRYMVYYYYDISL